MSEKGTGTQTALEPATSAKVVQPEALFHRMNEIHDAIARRAFEIFAGEGWITGRDLDNWFKAEAELFHPVHVNMSETDDAVRMQAEVPGFSPKELEVTIEPGRVTISGKKESSEEHKEGKTVYREQCSSEIFRVLDLPAEVEAAKATATLKNGVLALSVPKAKEGKKAGTTKVEVKAA